MARLSSRLSSKALLLTFISCLILISFNLPIVFHSKFMQLQHAMEKKASGILDKKVSMQDVEFLPYGELIFNNIEITDKESPASYIEIEKLRIRLSILDFLKQRSKILNRFTQAKSFRVKGSAFFKKPAFIGQVKYSMKISLTSDVISIERLFIELAKFNIEIRGTINNYATEPKAELEISLGEAGIYKTWEINNVYGNLYISQDELVVKNLDVFVNNLPFGITCRVSDFRSPSMEFTVMSYPGQLPSLRPFNPLNFELRFTGKKIGSFINGNLVMKTQKLISRNPREVYLARLILDDLSCRYINKAFSIDIKDILCETNAFQREVSMRAADLKTAAYLGKTKAYLGNFSLSAYGGFMNGNGFLDFNQWPPKLFLDFKFYKADIVELAKALKLDYELKGIMDFKGIFNNKKEPVLSGRVDIAEGYLKNIPLLGMVSDFLNVPSIKDLYFDHMSSMVSFSMERREFAFDNIIVNGQGMHLKGDARLKTSKKINGSMLVSLSTALLKESFKLRLLFLLIGERLPYQDFEFEIGGFIDSPQIKWLSTRFRENVMKYLTEGGRQSIEKSLEKAIRELLPAN